MRLVQSRFDLVDVVNMPDNGFVAEGISYHITNLSAP